MNDTLKTKISMLPKSSGVYLMKDSNGKIIYIGKAINLEKRVSQYFLRPQKGKVAAMVKRVNDFDLILTNTEKEALILEMNLIKTHYPRYNIMLRDDSHYPYIAISNDGPPIVKIVRNTKYKKYTYFGPFPRSTYAYDIVKLINTIYPTQKCRHLPSSVCLYYHLGQCKGYCVNNISEEENTKLRKEIISFLNGNVSDKRAEITQKMNEASEALNYEKAKEYYDILASIDHIISAQTSEISDKVDQDVFAFTTRDGYLALGVFFYRNGRLLGDDYFIDESAEEDVEAIPRLIEQFYDHHPKPKRILVGNEDVANSLRMLVDTKVLVPKAGIKKDLITLANKNVNEQLTSFFATNNMRIDNLEVLDYLKEVLHLDSLSYIELVDIAHLYGTDAIGVVVSYLNGVKQKKLYRKYNISPENRGDDYASISEVLTRHYQKKLDNGDTLPDLLIVDGGKGQLHKAKEVKEKLNLNIAIASLVKDDKHVTRGLLNEQGEEIFFAKGDKNFFLLMQMQDEVHRYAITSHRNKRSRSLFNSIFDDIKGLGIKRKERILSAYPTLDALKKASVSDLSQLVPEPIAEEIFNKINAIS
jgi:excinuclease ABC subunit C